MGRTTCSLPVAEDSSPIYETQEDGTRVMVRHPLVWKTNTPMHRVKGVVQRALAQLGYGATGEASTGSG
jgi:hypothetical protein